MMHRTARALAFCSALAFSLAGVAQAQRSGYTRQVSLPRGTVLRAELNESLSSIDSRPGDRFTGTIRADRDGSGLPEGTQVEGRVVAVRRASDRTPGTLDVDFTTLRLPDGRTYAVDGHLTSLDAKSVQRTSSGRLEARNTSSRDRNKFIGYGAGAGALIGVLSGGDLLKSALLGAAAGYLYGQLDKDKETRGRYADVNLKSGTEFGVALDREMVVAARDDRPGRYDSRYDSRYDRTDDRYRRDPRYDDRTAGSIERYGRDVRVIMDGREVRFRDARPFMSAGRVMVPLADVLDSAGYRYRYDTGAREITVFSDRGDARLRVGDDTAWIDDRRVRLDSPAQSIDGVLYVPVQFLEEATDIRAAWDSTDRTLRLTTRSRASLPYGYAR